MGGVKSNRTSAAHFPRELYLRISKSAQCALVFPPMYLPGMMDAP